MLGDQIVVCDGHGFWEPGCAAAEKPRGCRRLGSIVVIKSKPVLLAVLLQIRPWPPACGNLLAQGIEYPNVVIGDFVVPGGLKERVEYLWLRY